MSENAPKKWLQPLDPRKLYCQPILNFLSVCYKKLVVINTWPQVSGYKYQAAGLWLYQATGLWLEILGYRLLVINTNVQVGLQVGGYKYQATDWWL